RRCAASSSSACSASASRLFSTTCAPRRRSSSAAGAAVQVLASVAYPACTLDVVEGDLRAQPVDAIVNAATGHRAHGGGVAAIISRAAGPELQDECDRLVQKKGPYPTGAAVASTA